MSIYLQEAHNNLPRLLSLFNTDSISPTYGVGDRFYWSWKLIDFANATFQGAAHGLARLLVNQQVPEYLSTERILNYIHAMLIGLEHVSNANGSVNEAFPHEASYCVTALVAFDLLIAIKLVGKQLDQTIVTRGLSSIERLITFLKKHDENHAFIANHLATAAAALHLWHDVSGDGTAAKHGDIIVERILAKQSVEGWFLEYEGADPGYQSLATYYLAYLHHLKPQLGLLEPLRKSIQFLWHFAHPDGSFGGTYGSRNVNLYCPAGVLALAKEVPEAACLATFMEKALLNKKTILLSCLDAPNLTPHFNAYCWAAELAQQQQPSHHNLTLPALSGEHANKHFTEAGLVIFQRPEHYSIISIHKGGVCYSFTKQGKALRNDGVVIKKAKHYYSTQGYEKNNCYTINNNSIEIKAQFSALHHQLPGPSQFIVLRLLALTVMRFSKLNAWIKQALVKYLITGKKVIIPSNTRVITISDNVAIHDQSDMSKHYQAVKTHHFFAIHMASQGYLKPDEKEYEVSTL